MYLTLIYLSSLQHRGLNMSFAVPRRCHTLSPRVERYEGALVTPTTQIPSKRVTPRA